MEVELSELVDGLLQNLRLEALSFAMQFPFSCSQNNFLFDKILHLEDVATRIAA